METQLKYQTAFQDMQNNPYLLDTKIRHKFNQNIIGLEKGSIPLLHIQNHKFRDRFKNAELSKKGDVYLQHYLPAKQRALHTQSQFQSGHLKEDDFDPNLPHKNHSFWLKVRQITSEGPPIRFGLKKRTENERIMDKVTKGDIYILDHTAKDTKMIHYPDWKPVQKQNWVTNKNIDTTTCLYQGHKTSLPWQELPLRYNHEGNEYIDGLEKVGENIHRFREKKKECGRPDFLSTVQPDTVGQTLHISQSLRTFKSHKALGVDQTNQEFSKTKKLEFYKQPLIETKSVDHQVPYHHSQNIRSQPVRDLMPTTDKVYKQSIKQLMINSNKRKQSESNQYDAIKGDSDLRPFSALNSPSQRFQLQDVVKGFETSKFGQTQPNFNQQKISRGSQRSTQHSLTAKSRAQTAVAGKRKTMTDLTNLKSKLELDPYYQPSTQETKDLVKKYFH